MSTPESTSLANGSFSGSVPLSALVTGLDLRFLEELRIDGSPTSFSIAVLQTLAPRSGRSTSNYWLAAWLTSSSRRTTETRFELKDLMAIVNQDVEVLEKVFTKDAHLGS
jgi:hypothetical protein